MSNSRTKKSMQNVTIAAIGQTISLLLSFVSRTIFLQMLNVDYLGVSGLFTNILTMLSFAELGIGNAMIYNLYKPVSAGDTKKIQSLMDLYKKAYRWIAITILLIGISLVPFLNSLVDSPKIHESIIIIYLLFLFNTVSSYFLTYKKSILIADQSAYIITIITNIFRILQVFAQTLALYLTHEYLFFLITQILFSILGNIALAVVVDRKYPYLAEKNIKKIPAEERKAIFKDVKALAISKISGTLYSGTDNLIINSLLGLASVGYSSNYTMIINSVNGVTYNALGGLTGSIGNISVTNDNGKIKKVFDELFLATYLIYGYFTIMLMSLISPFISWMWGNSYVMNPMIVFSLILIIYQSGMNYPAYTFRVTKGIFEPVKYVYVASAFLNIVLSIFMGKIWGVAGVYFATSLAKAITCEISDGYYGFKLGMGVSPKEYFLKYYTVFFIWVLSLGFVYWILANINVTGFTGLLVKGVVGTLCIVIIDLILFSRQASFILLKERIINTIRKKSNVDKINGYVS